MLRLENVTMIFNKGTVNEKTAINDLSLVVNDKDFITVIGANGSGKSTLFNCICGSTQIDKGRIILDDKDLTYVPFHQRSRIIGRLFQDPMMGTAPDMTIAENLALAAGTGGWMHSLTRKDRQHFQEVLSGLNMGLEDRLDTPAGLLSGGQRQALTMIMATINPPKLLLLDEHTAALDPGSEEIIMEITQKIVADNNITCLMITHNMQSALQLGNRIIMMHNGSIVCDFRNGEKASLTVNDLISRFHQNTGSMLNNDEMLLRR